MASPVGYSKVQIELHWATVVLVALQYLFHDGIADAFDDGLEAGTMTMTVGALLHMASGMVILGLVIVRFYLRQSEGVPPPPVGEPVWAGAVSKTAHVAFYALLFLLPITGAAAWAQGSETAGDIHEVLRAFLFVLILAHVGAVIVHQFVWKTGLLSRMMRPSP